MLADAFVADQHYAPADGSAVLPTTDGQEWVLRGGNFQTSLVWDEDISPTIFDVRERASVSGVPHWTVGFRLARDAAP
jgi:hypothetical protein